MDKLKGYLCLKDTPILHDKDYIKWRDILIERYKAVWKALAKCN